MATTTLESRALIQQGYDYSPAELRELAWGLRVTPFVCMLGAAYGLYTQNPTVHFVLAALGILPFWFPAWHPVDRIYNHLLRPIWNGVKLPPNPLQRRIACLIGGSMNIGIGLGFMTGNNILAYTFGFILVPLQLIVISTHFCVASWMFEGAMRVVGKWTPPISGEEAKDLVANGALLVDVRDPDEFAHGHLDGAVNVPLDTIPDRIEELEQRPIILYCASGLRSQSAHSQLKTRGLDVHNMGAMTRYPHGTENA